MLRAANRDRVDLNIYMPLSERSNIASNKYAGTRLMELRSSDAAEYRQKQVKDNIDAFLQFVRFWLLFIINWSLFTGERIFREFAPILGS